MSAFGEGLNESSWLHLIPSGNVDELQQFDDLDRAAQLQAATRCSDQVLAGFEGSTLPYLRNLHASREAFCGGSVLCWVPRLSMTYHCACTLRILAVHDDTAFQLVPAFSTVSGSFRLQNALKGSGQKSDGKISPLYDCCLASPLVGFSSV